MKCDICYPQKMNLFEYFRSFILLVIDFRIFNNEDLVAQIFSHPSFFLILNYPISNNENIFVSIICSQENTFLKYDFIFRQTFPGVCIIEKSYIFIEKINKYICQNLLPQPTYILKT